MKPSLVPDGINSKAYYKFVIRVNFESDGRGRERERERERDRETERQTDRQRERGRREGERDTHTHRDNTHI